MPAIPSNNKIVVHVTAKQSLTDAVCQALHPDQETCEPTNIHQSLSSSVQQETNGRLEAQAAFAMSEWRAQLGVMLG